jgi:hypothetical protein
MLMSTRYITGVFFTLLGGFVVVASQSFSDAVLGWIAFGVAAAVIVLAGLAQLDRARGAAQRTLDGVTILAAAVMLAFSVAVSGSAVEWLSFGLALGIVALGVTGLSVNEIANWRAQRQLGDLHWLHRPDTAITTADHTPSRAA